MMNASHIVGENGAEGRSQRAGTMLLLALLAAGLSACKTKDADENRYSQPRSYSKPHRDPVEQRIFYEGWRHPSR